jgi:prepilin peptidase CpaA
MSQFLLWTAVAGGVFALLLLQARRVAPAYPGGPEWLGRLLTPQGDIPYGVAIAAGALAAYPASSLVQGFAAGV